MVQKIAKREQKRVRLLKEKTQIVRGIPVGLWTCTPTLRQMKSKAYMGLFTVGCRIEHPTSKNKSEVVRNLMVDTGSDYTWIDAAVLRRLGIEVRKTIALQMANGQVLTRPIGYAVLRLHNAETIDEVVFAEKGDFQLLGVRALEGLNLLVDPKRKRLVPGGPKIAANMVRRLR